MSSLFVEATGWIKKVEKITLSNGTVIPTYTIQELHDRTSANNGEYRDNNRYVVFSDYHNQIEPIIKEYCAKHNLEPKNVCLHLGLVSQPAYGGSIAYFMKLNVNENFPISVLANSTEPSTVTKARFTSKAKYIGKIINIGMKKNSNEIDEMLTIPEKDQSGGRKSKYAFYKVNVQTQDGKLSISTTIANTNEKTDDEIREEVATFRRSITGATVMMTGDYSGKSYKQDVTHSDGSVTTETRIGIPSFNVGPFDKVLLLDSIHVKSQKSTNTVSDTSVQNFEDPDIVSTINTDSNDTKKMNVTAPTPMKTPAPKKSEPETTNTVDLGTNTSNSMTPDEFDDEFSKEGYFDNTSDETGDDGDFNPFK